MKKFIDIEISNEKRFEALEDACEEYDMSYTFEDIEDGPGCIYRVYYDWEIELFYLGSLFERNFIAKIV